MVEDLFLSNIYKRVFAMLSKNTNRSITEVKIRDTQINQIHKLKNKASGGFLVGDSMLISLMKVIDSVTTKGNNAGTQATLNHFDPSFPLVKNANYLSSSQPAKNALLNYFIEIDDYGNIKLPDQKLIDKLTI
jgi:hypothetical protein